jgi:hypothetical protein
MFARYTYILKALLLGLLFVVPIRTTLLNAQESQDCPLMMRDYSALQEACADMPDGTLCYGAGDVTAFVDCEVTPDFNEMGDQLPLATVCALHAQGESENEMQTQGVALMRIASAVSEIPVQMIVMGDVNMQNNSSNATTFETRIDMEAEVRTGPSSQYSIIDTLNAGDIVYVNACNCTGNWLRITLPDGNVGWIAARRATVLDTGMGLPSITPDTPVYNVMQAFTFASAPADESCEQLPAGILIQAPSDVHVPLSINGVAFRLESTVFVHLEPYAMMMDVLDGAVSIETETQLLDVPEGTRIRIPMTLERLPNGDPELTFYTAGDVVDLPLPLLENPINRLKRLKMIPCVSWGKVCVMWYRMRAKQNVPFTSSTAMAMRLPTCKLISSAPPLVNGQAMIMTTHHVCKACHDWYAQLATNMLFGRRKLHWTCQIFHDADR